MSDLEEELRQVAGQAADRAQPLAAAEVIRRGDRRRRRRVVRDGVAVLMAAGAIVAGAGVLSASLDGGHPAPQSPAGRPAPAARPTPSPATRTPAPVPSPPRSSRPVPSRPASPGALPAATPGTVAPPGAAATPGGGPVPRPATRERDPRTGPAAR